MLILNVKKSCISKFSNPNSIIIVYKFQTSLLYKLLSLKNFIGSAVFSNFFEFGEHLVDAIYLSRSSGWEPLSQLSLMELFDISLKSKTLFQFLILFKVLDIIVWSGNQFCHRKRPTCLKREKKDLSWKLQKCFVIAF